MSGIQSDFRRVLSASGLYAAASLAQQGVSFLLLPVYTRFVPAAQYGQLELLNAFSAVVFALLVLGLPSALTKCYHRDCAGDAERASVLPTALALGFPVLLAGGFLMAACAAPLCRLLLGAGGGAALAAGAHAAGAGAAAGAGVAGLAGLSAGSGAGLDAGVLMVRLVAATGVLSSLVALLLANLRSQERALAFGLLTLAQFATAMGLNLLFVVRYGLGVRGILWGNLLANAVAVALAVAINLRRRGAGELRFNRRLARPLLAFGLMLLPVLLSAWVLDLSDRYVLRLYAGLSQVAVYAVGYKLGMALQLAVVWPFQLAWPAVSFSISHRPGHQETYSRTLTYLVAVMAFGIVGLTLGSRVAVPLMVGAAYREAYRVVPLVALAYAFNGIHYCISPGVHIAGKTRWFPLLAFGCGALNLGLNFLLIPRFGMMGAAWATAVAFAALALATAVLSQRVYPVAYEYGRLAKVAAAAALLLFLGTRLAPGARPIAAVCETALALAGLPVLLLAGGFFSAGERLALRRLLMRLPPRLRRRRPALLREAPVDDDRHPPGTLAPRGPRGSRGRPTDPLDLLDPPAPLDPLDPPGGEAAGADPVSLPLP